jgi:hypothetical protein
MRVSKWRPEGIGYDRITAIFVVSSANGVIDEIADEISSYGSYDRDNCQPEKCFLAHSLTPSKLGWRRQCRL